LLLICDANKTKNFHLLNRMLKDNNESNDFVLSILLQFAQIIIKCDSTIDSRTVYKAFVLQDIIRTNIYQIFFMIVLILTVMIK